MSNIKKISNKKLIELLHSSDDIDVLEETARRIKLGLIPLAIVDFSNLSNKKLKRIETLTLCDWATEELCKRMQDGRIPTKVITLDEIKKYYSQAG